MDLDFDKDDYSGSGAKKSSEKNDRSGVNSSLTGKLSWVDKLKKYVATKQEHPKTAAENDREADVEFLRLLEEEKTLTEKTNPSYKTIPKFFYKKPKEREDSLYHRVR